jgi:hypothetical protein
MKTAMQRMLDNLLAKRDVYENAKMYECVATLETSIEVAQFLIELEKEQIIAAGNFLPHDEQNEIKTPEEYYNQTFNK